MNMQVEKVLNNNVIISVDEHGHEVVVMGKGIGFQMKKGMPIHQQLIEKVFTLTKTDDKALDARYHELLGKIPLELLSVTESIVSLAERDLPGQLHPSVRISLADHLFFALERMVKGQQIKNAMLWEIRQLYPQEYRVGLEALQLLKEASGIQFDEDEAGFISLHLVNAQLNEDMNNTISVTNLIRDIVQMIQYQMQISLDENSTDFQRLVTHLKFFAHRLIHKTTIQSDDDSLFISIKEKYPQSFDCTKKIGQYVAKKYQHEMTSEEMMFLTIHIERVRRAAHP
ncbi:BglG family transcription antiterminator LicT [Vibrio sp. MEBiC08052]|uniref:BglG family transcription antiterminator LicT n=1 Tax=Vibrio sp. MEBiC08052 TaxID=1761910 RepID=UPI0007406539|nr:PRD domain-containing protein [Vibrio sp. MEBiC08052]KUJ00100.1 transcriptional regulatory protein [Vibrio sp. MEBiC08052]